MNRCNFSFYFSWPTQIHIYIYRYVSIRFRFRSQRASNNTEERWCQAFATAYHGQSRNLECAIRMRVPPSTCCGEECAIILELGYRTRYRCVFKRWRVSQWSKCSACDGKKGTRHRKVQCVRPAPIAGQDDIQANLDACKGRVPKQKEECVGEWCIVTSFLSILVD